MSEQKWVLQFCHGYDGPFLDCARQYAVLFTNTEYKVCTVYLTGAPSEEVIKGSASDEVLFLNYRAKDVRGLKLAAIGNIRKLIKSRNFALCIAHRFKPIYIALLATRLPVIGVQHAFGVYRRKSRQFFVTLFCQRLLLLGVSNAVRDDIRACLPRFSNDRIQTLYNRIDLEAVQCGQLSRDKARNFLGLPEDAWVIGNVGRLHPDKDQATLIKGFAEALPKLPEGSLLTIIGQGRLERSLKKLAVELGVEKNVYFLGQIPDARRYFRAFDLFALSSDHEPFGMVLLEAIAAGVPVIVTNCGGAKEVVEGGNDRYEFGDYHALAALLARRASGDGVVTPKIKEEFLDGYAKKKFWHYLAAGLKDD